MSNFAKIWGGGGLAPDTSSFDYRRLCIIHVSPIYINNYDDSKHVLFFSKPERGLDQISIPQLALAPSSLNKTTPILQLLGTLTCVRMGGGGHQTVLTWPPLSPLTLSCNNKGELLILPNLRFPKQPLLNVKVSIHFSSIHQQKIQKLSNTRYFIWRAKYIIRQSGGPVKLVLINDRY